MRPTGLATKRPGSIDTLSYWSNVDVNFLQNKTLTFVELHSAPFLVEEACHYFHISQTPLSQLYLICGSENHRHASQLWVWLCLKQVWATPLPQVLVFWGVTLKMRARFPLLTPHNSSHSTLWHFQLVEPEMSDPSSGGLHVWRALVQTSDTLESSLSVRCVLVCICVCVCVLLFFWPVFLSWQLANTCGLKMPTLLPALFCSFKTHKISGVEHMFPFSACSRFPAPLIQKGCLLYTPGKGI